MFLIHLDERSYTECNGQQKLLGYRAGPILEDGFSAYVTFENTGWFNGRFVAKIFTARIAAGSGALNVRDDVKMHDIVFLFQADQFDLGVVRRVGQRTQELGYKGIARRNTIDIGPLVVQCQRGDAHA